jgi:hypothetical protein
MLLLVPLWMLGGAAMHGGYRIIGLAAMTAMLVLVLDSAMVDVRRTWPFRRSVMVATMLTAAVTGALAVSGCIPA